MPEAVGQRATTVTTDPYAQVVMDESELDKEMPTHRQVTIEYQGFSAYVDEEIAPLILAIWHAGIWTTMSCQGSGKEPVWIYFDSREDVEALLEIVAGDYDPNLESLYNRA